MAGAREEMLEVTVDPLRMEADNITAQDLASVIARNNQLIPAGNLETRQGAFAVKVPGVVQNPADILSLPVKTNGDRVVTVGDIGTVRRTFKEPASISRYNGQPSMVLYVSKRPGSNLLDTVREVHEAVAADQKSWPPTIRADYSFDDSEFIAHTLTMLELGLITATLLVMLIIIGSLGVRQGIMVGMAIPICFMIAFLALGALKVTLNQMVMFGMVLAVGILVDGGIVVVEYADRKMAEGAHKAEAFAAAGKRMFWPVVNGTLTTLCAFVPFLFWDSIPGKFMSFLPLTLFFVLGASIFVALIFTPALGSILGRKQGADPEMLAEIEKSEHGDPSKMRGFMGWYARTIAAAGQRPLMVTAGAVAVIAVIIAGFILRPHATEFFLKEDPNQAQVYVMARGNLSIQDMDTEVRAVEQKLFNIKGVEALDTRVGHLTGGGGGNNQPPNDTIGRIALRFVDYDGEKKLHLTGMDIVGTIRTRLTETPGVQTELRLPESGPPEGKDVQVELRSENPEALDKVADMVRAHLAADPQIVELEDTRTSPGIQWDFTIDREAAGRYGVDVLSVGQAIEFVTDGLLAGKIRPDDSRDELDIRLRFPPEARNIGAFDHLKSQHAQGAGPGELFRQDGAGPAGDRHHPPRRPAPGDRPGQCPWGRGQPENRRAEDLARQDAHRSFGALEVHRRRRRGSERRGVLPGGDARDPVPDEPDPALAVQQLLRGGRDALGGDPVDGRGGPRHRPQPLPHLRLHIRDHVRHGGGRPVRGGGRPQHRARRHLLPTAKAGA